jgi:uracil-DNA glycosylase
LRNIFKEISDDLGTIFLPGSGNLEPWARCFTFERFVNSKRSYSNSHKHLKWNIFTDAVIQKISDGKEQVVFCCGVILHIKKDLIDRSKHLVLESGHPSMSANQGNW